MPNHKSAEKRMRQSERRRKINKSNRTRVRSSIKKLRGAIEAGSTKELSELLPLTISTIDKAVQKGVLHKNAASRYKSRLTLRSNAAINSK
jgi:small subunit ribosomal protein S20